MKHKLSLLALFVLFVLACGQVPTPTVPTVDVQAAIAQTQTAAFEKAWFSYTQTAAAIPTLASTQTLAPIPSTQTLAPIPTDTPEPVEDAYGLAAPQKLIELVEAFTDANVYVQQAGWDPSLVLNDDWKTRAGFALGVLNFRADEVAMLEPSPVFEKFHSYMVDFAIETHLFTEAYAQGVDNIDAESIERATEHMKNMTTLIQNATIELDSINNNP